MISIAEHQWCEATQISLEQCRFFAVLADGSADSSITEQYTVLVRYLMNGEPVTKLASNEAVESECVTGIKKGTETGISKVGLNTLVDKGPKRFSVNFD